MIDENIGEFHDGESDSAASPKLSRRALLTGLFALPIVALDAGSAQAQYIGFGPFRLHLGPTGGYGGGYPYRTRRPPRQAVHHSGGGGGSSRQAPRRSHRSSGHGGGGGGDTGGGANSSATGLGKADY